MLKRNILVKKCEPSDQPHLAQVVKRIISAFELIEMRDEEAVRSFASFHLLPNKYAFLVYYDQEAIGFAQLTLGLYQRNKHVAQLDIGLLPIFRGSGIDSVLLTEIEKHAIDLGVKRVEVELLQTNFIGMEFYVKHQFRIEGKEEKTIYSNGDYLDCYRMAKFL